MHRFTTLVVFLSGVCLAASSVIKLEEPSTQEAIIDGVSKFINFTGSHYPCPEPADIQPCTCSYDHRGKLVLDCSHVQSNGQLAQSLAAYFPYSEFSELKIGLNYHVTDLEDITRGQRYYSVYLDTPNLKHVAPNFLYQSFSTIEQITINNGELFEAEFPFSNLQYMSMLKVLSLRNNYLLHHLPSLKAPKLADFEFYSNGVRTLANAPFQNCPELLRVNLEHNYISHLPVHTFVIRAQYSYDFFFAYNRISSIENTAFYIPRADSNTKVFISLRRNQLAYLDGRTFRPLVDRTGNRTVVDISENPLLCDCQLAWMFENSPVHGYPYMKVFDGFGATCMNGTLLSELKKDDFAECFSQDVIDKQE